MRSLLLILITSVCGAASAQQVTQFRATLTPEAAVTSAGVTPDVSRFVADFSAEAEFTLTQPAAGTPTLAYTVTFSGVEFLDPSATTTDGIDFNEAEAIHIHNTAGVSHVAGTPHSLNLFGFPGEDDLDQMVDVSTSTVSGLWDDGDANPALAGSPGSTKTLSSQLDDLLAGELYLILHTSSEGALPGGITIAGQIVAVPEPSAAVLAVIGMVGFARRR